MIKLKSLLIKENEETTPSSSTFQMYHGGKRWQWLPTEIYASKKNRYEAGVGIYLTNSYNTARQYAKGSRVVHLVEINKNFRTAHEVKIPLSDVTNFIKNLSGMKHKTEIITTLTNNATRMESDSITADILNNLIVNYEAGAGKVGVQIANYLVSKGVDANVEKQSGDEIWIVVFNPKIFVKVTVVDPSKKIEFMLSGVNKT